MLEFKLLLLVDVLLVVYLLVMQSEFVVFKIYVFECGEGVVWVDVCVVGDELFGLFQLGVGIVLVDVVLCCVVDDVSGENIVLEIVLFGMVDCVQV